MELAFLSCSPPGRPPITFLPGNPAPGSSLGTSLGNILSNIRAGGESTSDPQKMDLSEDGSMIDKRVWMAESYKVIEEMARAERESIERAIARMDMRSDLQCNREVNESYNRTRRHQLLSEQFSEFRGCPPRLSPGGNKAVRFSINEEGEFSLKLDRKGKRSLKKSKRGGRSKFSRAEQSYRTKRRYNKANPRVSSPTSSESE